LEQLLVCELGMENLWRDLRGSMLLLALVTPVKTNGEDAGLVSMHFTDFFAAIVTDLCNIKATIGRVKTHNQW
ncbi:hypothetical protein J3R82DRAFT_3310, partial [Butyriboletus roseoflavus]